MYFQLPLSNFWSTFDTPPTSTLHFWMPRVLLLSDPPSVLRRGRPFSLSFYFKSKIHSRYSIILSKNFPINLLSLIEKESFTCHHVHVLQVHFPCSTETLSGVKRATCVNEAFWKWELSAELLQILIMANAGCQTQEAPLEMSDNIKRTGTFFPFPDSFTFSWGSTCFYILPLSNISCLTGFFMIPITTQG